jgi:hypothetical protein
MIARQYFIRVRDSFNGWTTAADKDKLEFLRKVDEIMYGQFNDRIDVDWIAGFDGFDFKIELGKEINAIIDRYNDTIDPEVSNDPRIQEYYISDIREPGDVIGCGQ